MRNHRVDSLVGYLGTGFSAATAATFYGLSRARGKRFFHPDGRAYAATYELTDPPAGWTVGGSQRKGTATVRLSRGASLTRLLPDVLGLAIRLHEINGSGGDQDFLLVTSGSAPALRHLLLPATNYSGELYSSILPYDCGAGTLMLGARSSNGNRPDPDGASGMAFDLLVSELTGPWRRIGRVTLGERFGEDSSDDLRFNPWNTGGGLAPAGPINALRQSVYRASQAARSEASSAP